jgi:arylsulfatase A-like enzyme
LSRWNKLDLLGAALGFGLLAGAGEVIAQTIRQRLMDRTLFLGPDYIWQLPVADAAIFLAVGALLLLCSLVWGALRAPRVAIVTFGGLTALSALMLTERIHIAAQIFLAAAIGVGMSRILAPRAEGLRRGLRIGVPIAILLLIGVAVAGRVARTAAEKRGLASLRADSGRPNILLLVLDTVRAWSLDLYGYGRPTTPRLRSWAQRGVVFDRALAAAPWTTQSHAVMFTGRHPTELSVEWNRPLDGTFPTLAEVLRDAGYATGGFGGNYLNVGRSTGLGRGFLHYEDYPLRPLAFIRNTSLLGRIFGIDRVAAMVGRRRMIPGLVGVDVNRRFLRWLDGRGTGPWFAFLNYYDAHGPYLPPAPYDTMYASKPDAAVDRYWARMQRLYGPPQIPLEVLAISLDAYDGAITYLDFQIDSLLRALAARGQLSNTIVVMTSDHGELFGEHGVIAHGNNLYLPVLHVPLIVIAPGRAPEGLRVERLASLRDLPATLLEMAGVANPGLPGHSLASAWNPSGDVGSQDPLFASVDYNRLLPKWPPAPVLRGSMRSVVLDSLQYILNGDGIEELYHLGRDSWEIRNLVTDPRYQAALAAHRAALNAIPKSTGRNPGRAR